MEKRGIPISYLRFIVVTLFTLSFPFTAMAIDAKEKITLGEMEDIMLLPWAVKLPARIDTGAAVSSLDVSGFTVKGNYVEATLPSRGDDLKLRMRLTGWRHIQSAEGGMRRPIVEIEICIDSRKFRTRVSLADRSHMEFPFLVGRNTLRKGNFAVDVRRSKVSPPDCRDDRSP